MKENLKPEQKEIAVKKAMATHLDAFFRAADVGMESVRYYEKPDAFRFKLKSGYAFLVSATKRGTNNFLAEVFRKLQDLFSVPSSIFGNTKEGIKTATEIAQARKEERNENHKTGS